MTANLSLYEGWRPCNKRPPAKLKAFKIFKSIKSLGSSYPQPSPPHNEQENPLFTDPKSVPLASYWDQGLLVCGYHLLLVSL